MKIFEMPKTLLRPSATVATLITATAVLAILSHAAAAPDFKFSVNPFTFDPFQTNLVSTAWISGAGCPTNATFFVFPSNTPSAFTDDACPTGDPNDTNNAGMVLVKSGPTANNASAGARINGVKGVSLTELGYDLRNGSNCDGGSPRFNVATSDGLFHFLACNSPAAETTTVGQGWTRLRWNTAGLAAAFPPITAAEVVSSIDLVFDEGADTGPVHSGLAVLDNIDVNGTLQGRP